MHVLKTRSQVSLAMKSIYSYIITILQDIKISPVTTSYRNKLITNNQIESIVYFGFYQHRSVHMHFYSFPPFIHPQKTTRVKNTNVLVIQPYQKQVVMYVSFIYIYMPL